MIETICKPRSKKRYLFQQFRTLINKILPDKIKVIALEVIIIGFFNRMPYTSQKLTPVVKIVYIAKEIPDVSFVFIVFIA